MDLVRPKSTKVDPFGPFWSRECQNPVRNKVSDQNGRLERSSTPGQGPESAEIVRSGVSKESEKSLKPDFRTLFGLF